MSVPSFAQLFRRSRYARFSLPGNDDPEHERMENERKEIFAVAAVGFALKHDAQFKKKFLKKFAGLEEDVERYQVSLQDAHCADLALKNGNRDILAVFEFKVGASLENHQNPWLGARKPDDNASPFWSKVKSGKNGYGYELGKNYSEFSTIYYTVVQQNERARDEEPCEKFGKTFWLKSRSWKTLLDPEHGLEEDLVKSLGELGIEELEDWRMKDIRVKNEDLKAFFKGQDAMELLLRISAKLGMKKNSASKDLVGYSTEGSHDVYRQIGIGLPNKALKMLGGIRAKCLKWTWFGYLSENNQQFKAQVWFYGNEGTQPKLRTLINAEMKNSARIEENPEDKKNGLRVCRSEDSALGDFDWFCKVLGIE